MSPVKMLVGEVAHQLLASIALGLLQYLSSSFSLLPDILKLERLEYSTANVLSTNPEYKLQLEQPGKLAKKFL
jgi:hypothetical protein